jgi:hypothetical protein
VRKHSGNLPDDLHERQEVEHKAACVSDHIDECMSKAQDSLHIESHLSAIEEAYGLHHIELVDAGTPDARVRYTVNPTYEKYVSGSIAYRMLGSTNGKSQTNVLFIPGSLTVNGETAQVGKEMVADPVAQDHQQGSDSSKDSAQSSLMAELPNAGNTKISNHSKYIKGHLLNDNIGGPGNAINLYPITADANAKHLSFVEKFVKSSVLAGYVIYYHVKVENEKINNGNEVECNFKFDFFRYDVNGNPVNNSRHQGSIQSVFGKTGGIPYDVKDEFGEFDGEMEYDKLNNSKITPKAKALGNEEELKVNNNFTLDNSGDGTFDIANKNNTGKNLPKVYGSSGSGGTETVGLEDITYVMGKNQLPKTVNGKFVVKADKDEDPNIKGWHAVELLHSSNNKISDGEKFFMNIANLKNGSLIDTGTPFMQPLKMAKQAKKKPATYKGGAYIKTLSMIDGAWTQMQVIYSLDHNINKDDIGWTRMDWM